MNDQELADAVVALGVGTDQATNPLHDGCYYIDNDWFNPDLFVRNGRVTAALMELFIGSVQIVHQNDMTICAVVVLDSDNKFVAHKIARHPHRQRAIIEACVRALNSVEQGLNDE